MDIYESCMNENSGHLPDQPILLFPCEGNGRNIFEARKIAIHDSLQRPPRILSENEIVRGAIVSRLLPSNNERPSYLNGEGSKPWLSLKPRGERKETIESGGRRGRGERKEGKGEKKERYASGPFSRRREGEGNSKEAGISSAFAWKYRSRNGIPIDRIFRSGEIQAYLPYFRASLSFDCTTFRF